MCMRGDFRIGFRERFLAAVGASVCPASGEKECRQLLRQFPEVLTDGRAFGPAHCRESLVIAVYGKPEEHQHER